MNKIAIAIDLELNPVTVNPLFGEPFKVWEPIEVGITEISLTEKRILKKVSLPIKYDKLLDPEIVALTGWTDKKLQRSGIPFTEVCRKLRDKFGAGNRLIIIDQWTELNPIHNACRNMNIYDPFLGWNEKPPSLFNICDFYRIKKNDFTSQSMESMLEGLGMEFEGRQHRASDDSYNIARIFLELIK